MFDHHALSGAHQEYYQRFCDFVDTHVKPHASAWDKRRGVPRDAIDHCAEAGFVGGLIPAEFGGGGWDTLTFGLLNEVVGAASSSLCAHFTVHNMAAMSLAKWASREQQERWLPRMASGEVIASFALTEPGAGSDIQAIETTFKKRGDVYLLDGTKKWITYSALSDVFLVFGKLDGQPLACLVGSKNPGVTVFPLKEMLGFRAAHLARIEFRECEVAEEDVLGKPGFALSHVAPYGLHFGRMSTAWSSAGLLRACLESAASHADRRHAFGKPIIDHGMIRRLVADMGVNLEAARHLCVAAALAEDAHSPKAVEKTLMAKLFASRAAAQAAADTVQILGAAGCHEESPAARYYRDAKHMQIIEGTDQVLQRVLGKSFCTRFGK